MADTKISFDEFVQDLIDSHDRLGEALENAESVQATLSRSGYNELANRIGKCVERIQAVSEVLDTLRKMHAQGKLRYGPRLPPSVWERRTVREDSPLVTQDLSRSDRPTRKLSLD